MANKIKKEEEEEENKFGWKDQFQLKPGVLNRRLMRKQRTCSDFDREDVGNLSITKAYKGKRIARTTKQRVMGNSSSTDIF